MVSGPRFKKNLTTNRNRIYFYFLFEANCSIFVKGALSIVDIGFYEHVKGLVHMEFFHIQ